LPVQLTRGKLGAIAAVGATLTGCSLLTRLDDPTSPSDLDAGYTDATIAVNDSGSDGGHADGASPTNDGGHVDASGDDGPDPCGALEAGAFCAYASGCQCTYCKNGACSDTKACPEGFNWEAGSDLARCCAGLAVLTDTNANCGVCGIQCATAGVSSPQNCALLDGHYQCVDCAANADCWSGCCATDTTPYHCAESDCNTGACVAGLCPAPSTCVFDAGETNYCSY
jgi:hypothetical protein